MVDFKHMVYVQERAQYEPMDEIADKDDVTILNISGTELRRRLSEGLEIPDWFSFPEVVNELRRTSPPRAKQGFTVFFTGLSGSGKSTIANALMVKLMEMGGRRVTLLDGDLVRKNLSSELGFSREHRDLNILRIGFVASEITKNGGIAICAPIAPYERVREEVRQILAALLVGDGLHGEAELPSALGVDLVQVFRRLQRTPTTVLLPEHVCEYLPGSRSLLARGFLRQSQRVGEHGCGVGQSATSGEPL